MSEVQTPTQEIVAASQPQNVTLEKGSRKVTVRKMTPIEQFRYKKVIGTFALNQGYTMDAMMIASVRNVDGNPMPFPQNEAGIEFILERLGDEGWDMVQEHFFALGVEKSEGIEAAKN